MKEKLSCEVLNIGFDRSLEIIADITSHIAFSEKVSDGSLVKYLTEKYKDNEVAFAMFSLGKLSQQHFDAGDRMFLMSSLIHNRSMIQEAFNLQRDNEYEDMQVLYKRLLYRYKREYKKLFEHGNIN